MNFIGCPIASIWADFMEGMNMKTTLRDRDVQGREEWEKDREALRWAEDG